MKFKNLLYLFIFLLTTNCYAEGQSGLGTFIFLIYLVCVCLYTLIGGIILKIIFQLLNFKENQTRNAFLTAFIFSVLLAFILESDFIFFL